MSYKIHLSTNCFLFIKHKALGVVTATIDLGIAGKVALW
jgi:hypothetical protein